MKLHFLAIPAAALLAVAPVPIASANLVQDGTFTGVTYSGTKTVTTLFGQFGTRTGSTLTVSGWGTSGYNFVFAPNTADTGTSANGANAGAANEAPGQYVTSAGYGSTYLWGSNNGGVNTLPATDPAGGNFIAADGAFETGAITQSITGLTAGNVYALTFYWAAAQQQSYSNATTESWQVALGGTTQNTAVVNNAAKGFSGWMQQTFNYTATAATETLSFLAVGTPSGQPPFVLLGGVDLSLVPEPSSWVFFVGVGILIMVCTVIRRRRRAALGPETSVSA